MRSFPSCCYCSSPLRERKLPAEEWGLTRIASAFGRRYFLLDISLPDANGLAIVRTLNSTCPTMHVVVLGDHDSEQYRAAAKASGASAYLHKEGTIDQLVPLIRGLATNPTTT